MHTHTHTYTHAHKHTHIFKTHSCNIAGRLLNSLIHIPTRARAYTHTQSHTRTHTHSHIHTHTVVRTHFTSISGMFRYKELNIKEISCHLNWDAECNKILYGVYRADKISKLGSLPTLIISKFKFRMLLIKIIKN